MRGRLDITKQVFHLDSWLGIRFVCVCRRLSVLKVEQDQTVNLDPRRKE